MSSTILSRDLLLSQLADGKWHPADELGPASFDGALPAWIRLLRLSGYGIAERVRDGTPEYRLETPLTPPQT